jgi:DNA-binding response OmpR family regulator
VITIARWGPEAEEFLLRLRDDLVTHHSRKIVIAKDSSVQDSALALEAGADDFLQSSISPREFSARILASQRSDSRPQRAEE